MTLEFWTEGSFAGKSGRVLKGRGQDQDSRTVKSAKETEEEQLNTFS